MRARRFVGIGLCLLAPAVLQAHHSFGTFLMNEDIELEGVVRKLDFVNPHSWLHLDVARANGEIATHRCEMRSATTLRRSGWTPEMFTPGTRLTIQGSPDRVDPLSCYVSTLLFADGTQLDRYGQRIEGKPVVERAARTPSGVPNLAGDWATEQLVMTDPSGREGTLVPLSRASSFEPGGVPEGQNAIAGARGTAEAAAGGLPLTRPPPRAAVELNEAGRIAMEALAAIPRAERSCAPGSILSDWSGESVNRVSQSAETIVLTYGRLGLERTIHLDLATHPANVAPSRAGHSIGRWDDDVLVVDTVGFLPGTLAGTTPHSDALHVIERFSLDPATMTLKRDYTAEDPTYLAEIYTRSDTVQPSAVPHAVEACADLTPMPDAAPAR
jgi:hypothetical protein